MCKFYSKSQKKLCDLVELEVNCLIYNVQVLYGLVFLAKSKAKMQLPLTRSVNKSNTNFIH